MKIINNKIVYETYKEILNPTRSALLIIDMQNDFCTPNGVFEKSGQDLTAIRHIIPKIKNLIDVARKIKIPIIYVQQTTKVEGKSDSTSWLRLKTRKGRNPDYTIEATWGWEIIDDLKPGTDDIIVKKYRSDSFIHTDLNLLLACNKIESLIIVGVVTEGCVESTLRSAVHHDYYAVLVEDCVASCNQDLHSAALLIMKSRYDVVPMKEVVALFD